MKQTSEKANQTKKPNPTRIRNHNRSREKKVPS